MFSKKRGRQERHRPSRLPAAHPATCPMQRRRRPPRAPTPRQRGQGAVTPPLRLRRCRGTIRRSRDRRGVQKSDGTADVRGSGSGRRLTILAAATCGGTGDCHASRSVRTRTSWSATTADRGAAGAASPVPTRSGRCSRHRFRPWDHNGKTAASGRSSDRDAVAEKGVRPSQGNMRARRPSQPGGSAAEK